MYVVAATIGGLIVLGDSAVAETPATSQASQSSAAPDMNSAVPPEMLARYAHAKWTMPSGKEMADIYPQRAQNEEVRGMAIVACTITADGYLDRCGILAEYPKGYGF